MNYLTYLDIKNFKGIENLKLKDLSSVNIIVGSNNIGKTSILEAISFLQSQNNIKTMLKHISRRESIYQSKFQLFSEIFPKKHSDQKNIQINSIINKRKRELNIEGDLDDKLFNGIMTIKLDDKYIIKKDIVLQDNNYIDESKGHDIIKIIYITPYDHFKDGLIATTIQKITKYEKIKIINLLQLFDSNIIDFDVLSINENQVSTYIQHKKYGNMPLFSFGDSIKKILTLACGIINAKEGILLVDEIETSLHKSMVIDVFKWIIKSCKEYSVQLICTTHSLEVIDSMIIASEYNIDNLSCFRIENYNDKVYGTRLSGNKLKDIRTFLGQDVR